MTKVFIDGSAGTTGLRIYERLFKRKDLELIILGDDVRKDPSARKDALNKADIAFLCLPDAAAIEAVGLVDNPDTVIIDTSTAHRTKDDFVYGFPELVGKDVIVKAKRIANPGCHASGFVALVKPLIDAKIIPNDINLSCFSLTGYSGGGKSMIASYEAEDKDPLYFGPRQYGLTQSHKHLAEMKKISGLTKAPAFCPIVDDFYSGMQVTVPLFGDEINGSIKDIAKVYKEIYQGKIVSFCENADENGFLSSVALSNTDAMQVTVMGNEERMILVSRFDNLGKGASGSAVQNMNIVLGLDETTGLEF